MAYLNVLRRSLVSGREGLRKKVRAAQYVSADEIKKILSVERSFL